MFRRVSIVRLLGGSFSWSRRTSHKFGPTTSPIRPWGPQLSVADVPKVPLAPPRVCIGYLQCFLFTGAQSWYRRAQSSSRELHNRPRAQKLVSVVLSLVLGAPRTVLGGEGLLSQGLNHFLLVAHPRNGLRKEGGSKSFFLATPQCWSLGHKYRRNSRGEGGRGQRPQLSDWRSHSPHPNFAPLPDLFRKQIKILAESHFASPSLTTFAPSI